MSSIVKHSIKFRGRKTSVSLEEPFWRAFRMIAAERDETVGELAAQIDNAREQGCNLSSAIRTFVLAYYVSREDRPPTAKRELSAL
jgi:predicted DNA-binding ribbon-helix-helix protein